MAAGLVASAAGVFFLSAALSLVIAAVLPRTVCASVTALYVFGDSTVDVGTNNHIQTVAQVNYAPYGIDFPGHVPTGRSSNGFNIVDEIAQQLGFSMSPPPFLSVEDLYLPKSTLSGISFASGGAGIFDEASNEIHAVTMRQQVQQFATVRGNLTRILGSELAVAAFLAKSMFMFSIGNNDVFVEWQTGMDKGAFVLHVTAKYRNYLTMLYMLGARKFGIIGLSPVGCCPHLLSLNGGKCSDDHNELARDMNTVMERVLYKMSFSLPGFKYSFGDTYVVVSSILSHPDLFNITETKASCCNTGAQFGLCVRTAPVCTNRDEFLFWDAYHPSQKAAALGAAAFSGGGMDTVRPINLKQLAAA